MSNLGGLSTRWGLDNNFAVRRRHRPTARMAAGPARGSPGQGDRNGFPPLARREMEDQRIRGASFRLLMVFPEGNTCKLPTGFWFRRRIGLDLRQELALAGETKDSIAAGETFQSEFQAAIAIRGLNDTELRGFRPRQRRLTRRVGCNGIAKVDCREVNFQGRGGMRSPWWSSSRILCATF